MSEQRDHADSPDERAARERGERVYDLYRRGSDLLEAGDFAAATIPLEQARALEPDKTSIREALGRAYFHAGRYLEAREEFAAVVERAPVNDYAHFCLGRAFQKTGRSAEARRHMKLAVGLRPDRADYRAYLERLAGRLAQRAPAAAGSIAAIGRALGFGGAVRHRVARRHRALGHEAEQAVDLALVHRAHRHVGVHPDVARRACRRSARAGWRGSSGGSSTG